MKKPKTDLMQVLMDRCNQEIKPVDPAERQRIQEANRAKKNRIELWAPREESAATEKPQTNEEKSSD